MSKKILLTLVSVIAIMILTACNKNDIKTHYSESENNDRTETPLKEPENSYTNLQSNGDNNKNEGVKEALPGKYSELLDAFLQNIETTQIPIYLPKEIELSSKEIEYTWFPDENKDKKFYIQSQSSSEEKYEISIGTSMSSVNYHTFVLSISGSKDRLTEFAVREIFPFTEATNIKDAKIYEIELAKGIKGMKYDLDNNAFGDTGIRWKSGVWDIQVCTNHTEEDAKELASALSLDNIPATEGYIYITEGNGGFSENIYWQTDKGFYLLDVQNTISLFAKLTSNMSLYEKIGN